MSFVERLSSFRGDFLIEFIIIIIQEYFLLVLCWEVCPLSEYVSLIGGFTVHDSYTCAIGHSIQLALSTGKSLSLIFVSASLLDFPSSAGRLKYNSIVHNIIIMQPLFEGPAIMSFIERCPLIKVKNVFAGLQPFTRGF